jgi:hypothetical protein
MQGGEVDRRVLSAAVHMGGPSSSSRMLALTCHAVRYFFAWPKNFFSLLYLNQLDGCDPSSSAATSAPSDEFCHTLMPTPFMNCSGNRGRWRSMEEGADRESVPPSIGAGA